jgi:prepilin-type N-terminal cleavage/methylation domain-containing protein
MMQLWRSEGMNKKGVTLIELVVVFVIIAIMAAFLAPSIGSWLTRYRLRSATRDIASTMRTAQMRAVSTGQTYQVNFTSGNSYVIQYLTTLGTVGGTEGAAQTLPSGITINTPGAIAKFSPNSTCPPDSLTSLTINQMKGSTIQNSRTITLSAATGRVTVQ